MKQSQIKATAKYVKKNYDEIKIRVKKGMKDEIRTEINNLGYDSMSKFITDATMEKIEREKR